MPDDDGPRTAGPRRLSAFTLLAAGMAALGLVVGAIFPPFAVLLGAPAPSVITPTFWGACFGAGLVLAGANWLLARALVGRRLRMLSDRLTAVAEELNRSHGTWRSGSAHGHQLQVTTGDDLGRTAAAFNHLLEALEAEHRFRALVQSTNDVFLLVDAAGRTTFASASLRTVLGWPPRALLGRPAETLVHPEDAAALRSLLSGASAAVVRVRSRDGRWRRLEVNAVDRRGDGDVDAVILSARDATERHVLQQRLSHQALHDALTGLPNREHLLTAARAQVPLCEEDAPLAVVMIDLDRFKEVNDTLGHTWGDRLLEQVGPRLRARIREQDLVARLGGDEFAVLLPGLDTDDARAAAQRLLDAFTEPFLVEGLALDVGASFGVAVSHGPQDVADPAAADGDADRGGDVDGLLRRADVAMYAAKELGTGVEVYDAGSDRHDRSRLVLLSQLRRGIADGQLVLHYQPKVALTGGDVIGVEALVRWNHPDRGLLQPGDFVPLAENSGLASQLTNAVIDLALAQMQRWSEQGLRVAVAVNATARCMQDPGLPGRVAAALQRHQVPAELLSLELTESALVTDRDSAAKVTTELRELGVRLSLDDFGTGYSSMVHLRSLPVDELKIDRSFVTGMLQSTEDAVLVASLVRLAHEMGVQVVAEGVEDAETLGALRSLSCDFAQGYHVHRPMPAEALVEWLAHHRTRPREVEGAVPAARRSTSGTGGVQDTGPAATTSTSTTAPTASPVTPTVVRAGSGPVNQPR